MHAVNPKVFVIGESMPRSLELESMLRHLGAPEWTTDAKSPSERIVEVAGRLCYKSFAPGLNPNVSRVREGNHQYIGNILKQHHGSVLEHASSTVAMLDVSRILTHEIVRHRAGCAYSQESMRYVRMEDIGMYEPGIIKSGGEDIQSKFRSAAVRMEEAYKDLVESFQLDAATDFAYKKEVTSALRRIAPGGHSTNIIVTANHRAWRHMIEMRTAEGAEEEIRVVFHNLAHQFKRLYPAMYQDMQSKWDELAPVTFDNNKV